MPRPRARAGLDHDLVPGAGQPAHDVGHERHAALAVGRLLRDADSHGARNRIRDGGVTHRQRRISGRGRRRRGAGDGRAAAAARAGDAAARLPRGGAPWRARAACRGVGRGRGAAVAAGVGGRGGRARRRARGTGASGSGLRASAITAWAVTHTGVWRLVRE